MFDGSLHYRDRGILTHAGTFPYPQQQGMHISKLLPWDGLKTVIPMQRRMGYAVRRFSEKYGVPYSRGEREVINWGPHHLNFMNKYGQFRGLYSAKLYKSIMYKGVSDTQDDFDTRWRMRAQRTVWGVDPKKGKKLTLKLFMRVKVYKPNIKIHVTVMSIPNNDQR